jgi:LAGLIDADG endonuclease
MPKKWEYAWAAGFIDGEGCFSLHSNQRVRLSVVQHDLRPLKKLQTIIGGSICGPHGPYSNGSTTPRWTLSMGAQKQLTEQVQMLWPYLSEPKREQWNKKQAEAEGNRQDRRAELGRRQLMYKNKKP